MINIQRRELYLGDFREDMFKIGLHLVAYELFSFEPDIDMAKLYSLILV